MLEVHTEPLGSKWLVLQNMASFRYGWPRKLVLTLGSTADIQSYHRFLPHTTVTACKDMIRQCSSNIDSEFSYERT
jgi:hypothetical protein